MHTNCFILKTYAKINLTLDIVGTRDDGMHLLKSVVLFINLFDTLLVEIGKDRDNIQFFPYPIENSTIHKLKKYVDIPFSVKVFKHIPIGRGLGGSSSNAGGLLGALVHLEILDKDTALKIAPLIGADVSMYLYKAPLLMEGIGEQITEIDSPFIPKTLHLIVPDFHSSTPMIYRAWDESPAYTNYTESFFKDGTMGNGLKPAFEKVFGLSIPGGVYLTGSGSAMFTQGIPNKLPSTWDIIEISTRKTGWEMMPCE